MKPKILLLDIETAPVLGYVWGLWQQNLGLEQIVQDWYILSFCAKWQGEDEIIYFDSAKKRDKTNDLHLIKKIHKLLEKADMVVAHNGDRFDIPKIQWRMLKYGMKPPAPFKSVDTLKAMKKHFKATSNKLAFVTDELNTGQKKRDHGKYPGFKLWKECLAGNQDAWNEMRDYNIADVVSLEETYLKLRPWWAQHPNMGVYNSAPGAACSSCGSHHLQARGFEVTKVAKYRRYQCQDCGSWSRGRKTEMLKETSELLLTSATRC